MKKFIKFGLFLITLFILFLNFSPNIVLAGYVNGYLKSNGTYVNGYYRSSPDGNPYNNYSFPGNTNPYTGKVAGGSVDSYLNNYYGSSYTLPTYTPTYIPTYTPTAPTYSGYTGTGTGASSYQSISGGYKSYGIITCDYGYYENGDKCTKTPKNSYTIGSNFYCDYGYEKTGGKCLSEDQIIKKEARKIKAKQTKCEKKGDVWYDNSCFEKLELCQFAFGTNSTYLSGETATDMKCSCELGYQFSTVGEKSCVRSNL